MKLFSRTGLSLVALAAALLASAVSTARQPEDPQTEAAVTEADETAAEEQTAEEPATHEPDAGLEPRVRPRIGPREPEPAVASTPEPGAESEPGDEAAGDTSPFDYRASEQISEDLSVSFPVDI